MARRFLLEDRLSRARLEQLYLGEGLSTIEISGLYDVSGSSVAQLLKLYGIRKRPRRGRLSTKEIESV